MPVNLQQNGFKRLIDYYAMIAMEKFVFFLSLSFILAPQKKNTESRFYFRKVSIWSISIDFPIRECYA